MDVEHGFLFVDILQDSLDGRSGRRNPYTEQHKQRRNAHIGLYPCVDWDLTHVLTSSTTEDSALLRAGGLCNLQEIRKNELRGFGPLAKYADRATAACWRISAKFCG
jgi:hypothetical protein